MKSYEEFKATIYANLVLYKEQNITKECGNYKGSPSKEFLPETYWEYELPGRMSEILIFLMPLI